MNSVLFVTAVYATASLEEALTKGWVQDLGGVALTEQEQRAIVRSGREKSQGSATTSGFFICNI